MMMKRVLPVVGAVAAVFVSIDAATAQRQQSAQGSDALGFFTRAPLEFWLACLIALVALIVITLLLVFLNRVQNRKADDIAAPVIVVVIVFGVLILSTTGLRNEQVAPAFALFGTIVGYLLGRLERPGGK